MGSIGAKDLGSTIDKARMEAFNNLESKGNTIVDYVVASNNVILALVKSKKGGYSIRQSFLMGTGDKYQGFVIYRLLHDKSVDSAQSNFDIDMATIRKTALIKTKEEDKYRRRK